MNVPSPRARRSSKSRRPSADRVLVSVTFTLLSRCDVGSICTMTVSHRRFRADNSASTCSNPIFRSDMVTVSTSTVNNSKAPRTSVRTVSPKIATVTSGKAAPAASRTMPTNCRLPAGVLFCARIACAGARTAQSASRATSGVRRGEMGNRPSSGRASTCAAARRALGCGRDSRASDGKLSQFAPFVQRAHAPCRGSGPLALFREGRHLTKCLIHHLPM